MPSSRGSVHPRDRIQSPHCRWILYSLSYQGSPRVLEWVASPSAVGLSDPKNWTRISCRQILKKHYWILISESFKFKRHSVTFKSLEILSLCPLSCCLPSSCQNPCYPTNWLRGTLFLCSQNPVVSFLSLVCASPSKSWALFETPFRLKPLHEVFSDHCSLIKTFLFEGVLNPNSPPLTTSHLNLTRCHLLKPRVCPDGLQFCGILVPHFTFTGCSQRRSPASPYELTSVESLLLQ